MPIFSSDTNGYNAPSQKFFSRQKSIYSILGRGKVADIVLWRKKNQSAGILFGCTFVWFLFQVLDYTFITLLCRSIIFVMIGLLLWSNGAGFVNCPPPRLPDIGLSESAFRKLFIKIRRFSEIFYEITQGRDMRLFVVIIVTLWIFSVLGKYFSTINLLYIGFLCLETMPALYIKYKDEIDYLASRVSRDARKMLKKLDSRVLYKIPRGPCLSNREKLATRCLQYYSHSHTVFCVVMFLLFIIFTVVFSCADGEPRDNQASRAVPYGTSCQAGCGGGCGAWEIYSTP